MLAFGREWSENGLKFFALAWFVIWTRLQLNILKCGKKYQQINLNNCYKLDFFHYVTLIISVKRDPLKQIVHNKSLGLFFGV